MDSVVILVNVTFKRVHFNFSIVLVLHTKKAQIFKNILCFLLQDAKDYLLSWLVARTTHTLGNVVVLLMLWAPCTKG